MSPTPKETCKTTTICKASYLQAISPAQSLRRYIKENGAWRWFRQPAILDDLTTIEKRIGDAVSASPFFAEFMAQPIKSIKGNYSAATLHVNARKMC